MKRKPSEAWYLLAAAVVLLSMAFAAFGLGSQVRSILDQIQTISPTATVSLDAGETRTLFRRVDGPPAFHPMPQPQAQWQASCQVMLNQQRLTSAWQPVETTTQVTIDGHDWRAVVVLQAPSTGDYTFICPSGSYALGPSFGVDGRSTATTIADWAGTFALRFIPGLILGGVIAGFVAWRRRSTT